MNTRIIAVMALLCLAACTNGQNKLVNRWTAAGHLRHGKLVPENNKGRGYEFLKNGTFNVYKDGMIEGSGTYVMASDSKSVLLKDGNQSGSLKIMKLTSTELVMIFNPGRDTIVFYPSGSTNAKQAQAKTEAYHKAKKDWSSLLAEYHRRNDVIENIILSLNAGQTKENSVLLFITDFIKYAEELEVDFNRLTKDEYEMILRFQDDLSERERKESIQEYIKLRYPRSDPPSSYAERVTQILALEKNIETLKRNFIKSFNTYISL